LVGQGICWEQLNSTTAIPPVKSQALFIFQTKDEIILFRSACPI